ncbi:MAG: DM13 domain-containing protein [Actinomycetota bacterium]
MKIVEKIKNNKLAFGGGGLAVLGILSWVAFGYFGIHTAFIDDVVDEDGPVFTVTPEGDGETAAGTADADASAATDTEDPAESATDGAEEPAADAASETAEVEAPAEEPAATESAEPAAGEVVTIFDGDFTSLSRYSVSGDALVLNNGTEQRFLRFENFDSSNGPDLKVYLRAENGDFVSLGNLSGNIGNQNYEIPVGVDLEVFNTVEIWCERFSVGFGEALLSPTA